MDAQTTKQYLHKKYSGLCNFLESNTAASDFLLYGVSTTMLLLAYAKRRPAYLVRQFKKPAHIPEQLIAARVPHTGLIKDIQQRDQDTLLLMISHRPWFSWLSSSRNVLAVKLPGVRVNGNGYAWLQHCLVGREATFIPMQKKEQKDYVISQLCLMHPPKGDGQLLDISETLLKLRFAQFTGYEAAKVDKYYKHLQRVETVSAIRESWIAWAARHPWIWTAWRDLQVALLPKARLLPEIVRRQ